jgi:ABC-type transporter Mla subunit MlaD
MDNEKEEWSDVEISDSEEESVEYEVEDSEDSSEKEEVKPEEVKASSEEIPQELEGIETKGAQKRIRQLIKQRRDRDNQIQTLLAQNEQLTSHVQNKDTELFNANKLSLDTSEKQLTDKVELARQVYLEAFDDGDKEALLKAQETLNDAQADLKMINFAKVDYQEDVKQPQPITPPTETQVIQDPKAAAWAEQNEWFGKDTIRTAAALAVDAELKGEGYDPNDKEYYEEINSRMQEAFPQKYKRVQENTSQPAQVVSGASRLSPTSGKKVKLSKEDVRLAQKWGIPLEHYAAEKLKVSQADGEYTNIN